MEAIQENGEEIGAHRIIFSFDIGIKNLAVCVLSAGTGAPFGAQDAIPSPAQKGAPAHIVEWKIISLAAEKERIPVMNELTGRLFLALDELVDNVATKLGVPVNELYVDTVLLENQPSRLNGGMKSVQMIIYSYFQLRKHWEGIVRQVLLVSASEKLKGHDEATATIDMGQFAEAAPLEGAPRKTAKQKKAKSYQNNKKIGIVITKYYLRENEELLRQFCSYKKADDYADALLQAISWLRKHGDRISLVE